jgi:hypothetical protein
MLCLTSKSYQLCKPRQADIREQLHSLGPKTNVDIATLNLGNISLNRPAGPASTSGLVGHGRPERPGYAYCLHSRAGLELANSTPHLA